MSEKEKTLTHYQLATAQQKQKEIGMIQEL